MGIFSRKPKEKIAESWRLDFLRHEEEKKSSDADLRCEEAIVKEKERYGRVRKSLMTYLRAEHGRQAADRALWRVNKRLREGYLQ